MHQPSIPCNCLLTHFFTSLGTRLGPNVTRLLPLTSRAPIVDKEVIRKRQLFFFLGLKWLHWLHGWTDGLSECWEPSRRVGCWLRGKKGVVLKDNLQFGIQIGLRNTRVLYFQSSSEKSKNDPQFLRNVSSRMRFQLAGSAVNRALRSTVAQKSRDPCSFLNVLRLVEQRGRTYSSVWCSQYNSCLKQVFSVIYSLSFKL